MPSFNLVVLMGNLTKDPESRTTPNGTAVANFSLAVNHRYKQNDEMKEEVCFIDIVVWGKNAENCAKFLSRGNPVIVEGRLQQQQWETDGQKRSRHVVVAQNVTFMPKTEKKEEPESDRPYGDVPF